MADAISVTQGDASHAILERLRVAIVHPFLISQGGGEKVIDALAAIFPQAEFFALLVDREKLSPALRGRRIHATFLNRLPSAHRRYQHLSPLFDVATARHDLRGFDLVISSGGPGAKTVKVAPGTVHIHYCHSPVRYLWDQYEAWLQRMPALARPVFAATARAQRARDYAGAQRVDAFIANSDYIGQRIRQYYDRDSTTIYPPVAINRCPVSADAGNYYLTVGRLVPGKRTELLMEACARLGHRLIVVGGGPEEASLRQHVGPTVTMTGRVDDAELIDLYRNARAFLFAADEDFGIATVEAQSYGLPAIAYGHGGSLEILTAGGEGSPSGSAVFFQEQTVDAIMAAIVQFEEIEGSFDRASIQRQAERFSEAIFARRMREFIASAVAGTGQCQR